MFAPKTSNLIDVNHSLVAINDLKPFNKTAACFGHHFSRFVCVVDNNNLHQSVLARSNVLSPQFGGSSSGPGTPQAVFTSFKLPKPGPALQQDFPVPSSLGYNFSVGAMRPPMPQFTTTTQFNIGNISSDSNINLGPGQETKKELYESPTAPSQEEDVQKIQENNNNNQSESESNSEEVTPPKNQGLIKVHRNGTFNSRYSQQQSPPRVRKMF